MTTIGKRLKTLRGKESYRKLAERIGISPTFLSDIEKGKAKPSYENLLIIAEKMGTTISYLTGETSDPSSVTPYMPSMARVDTKEKLEIPVISMHFKVCAGTGNGLDYTDMEDGKRMLIDKDIIRTFDDTRTPFGVVVEGDSMSEQGIDDGSTVVVNPAEPVLDGDIALVAYKGQWSVKGIMYLHDGGIRLLAGKQQYERIVPQDAVDDDSWFRIIGKVVYVQPKGYLPQRFL